MDIIMQNKRYLGSFELASVVFNLLICHSFTSWAAVFPRFAGSAAWLLSLIAGLIFLGVTALLLRFFRPVEESGIFGIPALCRPFFRIPLIIFLFAAAAAAGVYSVNVFVHTAQKISYHSSPFWFPALFLLGGAFIACIFGRNAVFRLHSLFTLYIGAVFSVILFSSLAGADAYHPAPVFGTGVSMLRGLPAALLPYSDILLIFFLSPFKRKEVNFSRTVLLSSAAAVLLNVIFMLVFCLHAPYEVSRSIEVPLCPLAKSARFGKFPSRLDAFYLTAFTLSSMLYLSLILSFIIRLLQKVNFRTHGHFRFKKLCIAFSALACCFSLTSCKDSRDVEESAYLIALGADSGNKDMYRFTFQISSPLHSGKNTILPGTNSVPAANAKPPSENKNADQAVSNFTIEAPDCFTAAMQLKSSLGKQVEATHLKLIVFSAEIAEKGIPVQSNIFMRERELRPSTALCVAEEGAQTFLSEVRPSFEQTAARYYELLFGNKGNPYSATTDLREFVNCANDRGIDAALPIADNGKISGTALFDNEKMVGKVTGEDAVLLKLLSGTCNSLDMNVCGAAVRLTSKSKPKISLEYRDGRLQSYITADIKAETVRGNITKDALCSALRERCSDFLSYALGNNCDILGFGRIIKARCTTQQKWEALSYTISDTNIQNNIYFRISGSF